MNFLCHAIPHLDQPLLAAATGIPDWMSMVDRKIRARSRFALPHFDSDDESLAQVARGIVMHHDDDRWFHATEAFVTTNMELSLQLRDQLPGDKGFRPSFVGHILIEMLLDAQWLRTNPDFGKRYYETVSSVSAEEIQRCVNIVTGKPTEGLAPVIERFAKIQFLYDYLDNDTLLMRLNQVMSRVGLTQLPPSIKDWLPDADRMVESRRVQLLTPPGSESPFPL